MARAAVFAVACSASLSAGCAVRTVPIARTGGQPCATAGGAVEWYGPTRDGDRRRLAAWCESVGAAVVMAPDPSRRSSPALAASGGEAAVLAAPRGGAVPTGAERSSATSEPRGIAQAGAPGGADAGRRGESTASPRAGGDLVVVTWNVHEGAGDLARLVESLRPGHVVVLVQEALRRDASVPAAYPRSVRVPKHEPGRGGDDIVALADRLSLWLAYVPSMRNGNSVGEDRGNAILSTLPLSEARAIELPWVHQRRVAVMATVGGDAPSGGTDGNGVSSGSNGSSGSGGSSASEGSRGGAVSAGSRTGGSHGSAGASGVPPLRVVSAHLDNRPGRASQAASLAAWLRAFAADRSAPLVVGADLNTWFGAGEEAVHRIADVVPLVAECGNRATFRFRLRLDYLFSTIPLSARRGCEVGADRLGSDHRPVRLTIAPSRK